MAITMIYTLPIYEAVVCNLSLEKMWQEETEQEHAKLAAKTLDCVVASKEVLKLLKDGDFSLASVDGIAHTAVALGVLLFIGRQTVANIRESLPSISEGYRPALTTAIDELDGINDRLEHICEAWRIASDEGQVAKIKEALSTKKNPTAAEVPPWRKTLASFSD